MADISVIKLPNGNSYNLKDTTARSVANSAVPNTRTVNGKALSSDISLGAGDVGAYTKGETDTKINAAVASAYKYKGSITADKLPTSGQVVGDVYNVTNDSSYGKAGMNVAWNGTAWDALGSNVDLSNYVTTSDSRLSNARPASDVYAWAKAAKKPSYSASEINGLGSLATKNGLSAGDVGLGNVANIDQSKAIKSITRNGTTFTATALDGTTSTFTQQDTNTTYGLASTTSNGLMSAADKKAIDREFFRLLPKGGTYIPANADLNSIEYLKIGNYYACPNIDARTIKNIPKQYSFMMYVLSPISTAYDDESSSQWVYRLRIFVTYSGEIYTQFVHSETTNGVFTYNAWIKLATDKSDVGLSNVDNTADSAKSVKYATSAGSANSVAWGNVSGRPSSLPANGGNSSTVNGHTVNADVPSGAKFTDTTYSAATQSSPGLMSAADKKKLDSYTTGSAGGAVEVTLAVASWSSSTTEINGNKYYTYSVSVPNIGNPHPQIFCGGGDSIIPSATQESEFNHIRYTLVDTAKSTVTFYSIEKPSVAINVVIKDYLENSIVSGTSSVTIATSDWSSTTSTVNGRAFYTAKKTLNSVSSDYPTIICGTVDTLPSNAEQTAFDCINYAAADTSTKTVTFYAIQKPTSAVVAIVI